MTTKMMTKDIAALRMLEIAVITAIAAKYNGVLPVRILFKESEMLRGHDITCYVPGQTRTVFIKGSIEDAFARLDEVVEEVSFAIFLLLDEDIAEGD